MKYTKLYSDGKPELIEGDIFKTIIPLVKTSKKQANRTSGKKRAVLTHLEKHGQATVAEFADVFKLSEGRVRAILLEMTKENLIEKVGKTKSVYYVLKQQ